MKTYIGTKVINAKPMTRLAYNQFRGWTLPADENGADEGYLVEYTDGGKGNTDLYAGYVSWSPKEQFEKAYRKTAGLPFGLALEALKLGKKLARAGWNGKGMWLRLIQPYGMHPDQGGDPSGAYFNPYFKASDNNVHAIGTMLPWIGMKTACNGFVPWLASQTDVLAEDWQVFE